MNNKKILPKTRAEQLRSNENISEAYNSDYRATATSVDGEFSNTVTNINPSYNGKDTIDFITNTVRYSIRPSADNTAYVISIWIALTSSVMRWTTGQCFLTVRCNGQLPTEGADYKAALPLTTSIHESEVGPFVFTFPSYAVSYVTIDVTANNEFRLDEQWGSACSICGSFAGPGYKTAHNNGVRAHFTGWSLSSGLINVETIPLGNKPATPTLTNNNSYNGNASISANTDSLTIGVSTSDWGKPDDTVIVWSCSNGASGEIAKTSQFNISGLSPGTSYTVTVYLRNSMGSSESTSITIRTKNNKPIVTLNVDSVDLEKINLSWASNVDLGDTQYKIDNGSWQKLNQTGRSGSFVAKWFDPNTTHTIYFWGQSTSAHDSIGSDTISKQGTTLDKAHVTSVGSCTFGLPIKVTIESESSRPLQLEIWTEGNSLSPRFTFTVSEGTFTFNPTQSQLDDMYRCYPKSNQIPIHFLLTTKGEWKNWQDTRQDKTLTLTGIAKTGHAGVNNSPRRCQVWWGDRNNNPHRAVFWTGDRSNTARRTI